MLSDGELLQRYVDDGSEAAFTELVQRHINLVYLAALRRVGGNAHAADDVAQKVFTGLARKARSLTGRENLAGWLYTSTRYAAVDVVRAEQRRRTHEQEAHCMNEVNAETRIAAGQLEPLLDQVMDLLPERDREAVLLHFFEGRSFAEVGDAMALNADAARMRVNRALERLRTVLARRGVTSTAAVLAGALAVQSTLAAPSSLALTMATRVLSNASAAGPLASLLHRVTDGTHLLRMASWTGGAVILVLAVLTLRPTAIKAPSANPAAVMQSSTAPNVAAATVEVPAPSSVVNGADIAPATLPAGPSATASVRTGGTEFTALSTVERTLLARLWYLHETHPPSPGVRVGLKPDTAGPNIEKIEAGYEDLVAKGWVMTSANEQMFYLSAKGVAFCKSHRAEIENSPAFQRASAAIR